MNSQSPLNDKSHFFILVGVSQGIVDLVELFDCESAANAALEPIQDDYHPEADDLRVFGVHLTASSATSQLKL